MDLFQQSFKYYKRRKPPPDLSSVIDLHIISDQMPDKVVQFKFTQPQIPHISCLKPVTEWRGYSLYDHPGFVFIVNPFVNDCKKYWVKRCLEDYTQPSNRSNLDALAGASGWHDLWQSSLSGRSEDKAKLLEKLHWVTLGLHHNWDTKEYAIDNCSEMPSDLSLLARYIANAVGFANYHPEAAILNYYHIGSTLGGHTDHSEFNFEAPIVSLSFGCSAVFLLGGPTKDVEPVPVLVDCGDIVVMAGASRLAYHAVPRILTPDERDRLTLNYTRHDCSKNSTSHDRLELSTSAAVSAVLGESNIADMNDSVTHMLSTSERKEVSSDSDLNQKISSLNCDINRAVSTVDWSPLEIYLRKTRLNLNIRQVFQRHDDTS